MELICLLPKKQVQEDLMEVLEFVKEDLNVLYDGSFLFFFFYKQKVKLFIKIKP